ncbi:DODA-type extradiol aromatic ring-opening family dioxygenase [Paenibacillus illinoisensis]|uniref:DODA-type extradiol aromatic ring-opening family dioxygenase n=1 Tax=Paenibacillus illinoisensis TaxID=59845 RepID=UPI003D2DFEB2
MTLPAFFIAHGSPAMAVESNDYTQFLNQLGNRLPAPKAIVVFTAHWDCPEPSVTMDDTHQTLHDFYGFPSNMYTIDYPAPGHSELASEICALFTRSNLPHQPVLGRGLDHGVWVPLLHMYPQANIPVVVVSVDSLRSPQEQYDIGRMLEQLRHDDVLIIGSGGTVHNLRLLGSNEDEPEDWAVAFDDWMEERLEKWNTRELFQYDKKAPNARTAVPSYGTEHLAPLFYAMGTADMSRKAKRLFQSYPYGTLSLNCWQFGDGV